MSSYNNYDNYNRYDSALDLSQSGQSQSDNYHDHEDYQTINASSVSHYPAPWSQLNLRHDADPFTSFVDPNYTSATSRPDDLDSFGVTSQTFDDAFMPYIPGPRYYSPDAESPTNCSVPPSPTPPRPWAATSSATASPTLVTSNHTDSNTIPCGKCNKEFSGTYRRGNLARHVRQKHLHPKGGSYPCTAEGCPKVFQRADARLKHERNKHSGLHSPPVHRKHGTDHSATVKEGDSGASNPTLTYVGHWLQAGQGLVDSHVSTAQHLIDPAGRIEQLPLAATSVFQRLQSKLEPEAYARVCDSFFSRWESVVQQLKEDRSEAYNVYAKVLNDIYAVVHAIDPRVALDGTRCHAAYNNARAVPPSKGGSILGSANGNTSQNGRVSKQSDRRQSIGNGSRKNNAVRVSKPAKEILHALVDCPIFKHHQMYGTTPPCRGCRVNVMAQVRGHLNPIRAGTHRGFPSFIAHCSRCEQDFINQQEYDDHTAAHDCDFNPQIRGDILTSWVRLYLTLYPGARSVPSPWINDNTWLPESVVAPCRRPFLGHRQRRNIPPIPTTPVTSSSLPLPGYDFALGHVLHDIVNPAMIHPPESTSPISNPNRMSTTDLQRSLTASPTVTNHQHWQNVLRSFRTHQRTLREAAAYLTTDQIREMAEQAETVFRLSSYLSQQQQRQEQQPQGQSQSSNQWHPQYQLQLQSLAQSPMPSTTDRSQGTLGAGYIPSITPIRSSVTPFTSYGQYLTPTSSTQPSSAGNRTGSSLNYNSSITTPSSTQQQFDSYHLSPESPLNQRRTSLPPGLNPSTTYQRLTVPSSLSLPENTDNLGSPYMEPSVPPTPNEELEDPFYFLNPQFRQT